MTSRSFEGQVAIVTGAAGFIGSRTARVLADAGAAIACLDVVDPSGVVDDLRSAGYDAFGATVDVADAEAVTKVFEELREWRGQIDVLVNMAGLYYKIPRVPFWEIDPDTWDEMIDANLRSAFLCTRAAAGPMREAGRGRVVNVSSNTAVFGMANFLHYNAAKAGVVGMTRGMARELGPYGIAVNAVAPGLVKTPGGQQTLAPEYWDQVVSGQCLRTPIEIDDVVNAVAFLASEQSRMVTGQTLLVNGGASMGSF